MCQLNVVRLGGELHGHACVSVEDDVKLNESSANRRY